MRHDVLIDISKANIRMATPRDAGAIAELLMQFDADSTNQRPSTSMARFLATPGSEIVFVADIGGSPIGFLTLQITHCVSYVRATAEVTAIFVADDHRRGGVASRLRDAALQTAQESHAMALFLRVNTANQAAIRFYERRGLNRTDHLEYRVTFYGRNQP